MNISEHSRFRKDGYTPPLNGVEDSIRLPSDLTISRGQEFSGLQLLQYPRLMDFVKANKDKFTQPTIRDVVVYVGPDMEIP